MSSLLEKTKLCCWYVATYNTKIDVTGLQNHLTTMHRENLEVVANALAHRSDPAKIPDISGMDGIPAQDLQEYKSRTHPNSTIQQAPTLPAFALLKQFQPVKADVPAMKRAKIDTPLGAETIQAQLAEFQRRKAQQEIQELQTQGILFPPGLPAHSALSLFAFRTAPPGTGPYAAKSASVTLPTTTSATDIKDDGKSDVPTTAALSSQSIINLSASASASPKFVSKSVFLLAISADDGIDLLRHRVSSLRNLIRCCRCRLRHLRPLRRDRNFILLVRQADRSTRTVLQVLEGKEVRLHCLI